MAKIRSFLFFRQQFLKVSIFEKVRKVLIYHLNSRKALKTDEKILTFVV